MIFFPSYYILSLYLICRETSLELDLGHAAEVRHRAPWSNRLHGRPYGRIHGCHISRILAMGDCGPE